MLTQFLEKTLIRISLLSEDSESDLEDPEIGLSTKLSSGSLVISSKGGMEKYILQIFKDWDLVGKS